MHGVLEAGRITSNASLVFPGILIQALDQLGPFVFWINLQPSGKGLSEPQLVILWYEIKSSKEKSAAFSLLEQIFI